MGRPKLATLKPSIQMAPSRGRIVESVSWRADKQTSTQRGYGYRWQKGRALFLREHPMCCYCQRNGLVGVLASVVDHIIPHRGDQNLFWDESNWQPLCAPCHDVVKRQEERSSGM